jgi:hypothetical protein
MRKKPVAPEPPVVPPQLIEEARKALDTDVFRRTASCSVCGSDCSEGNAEERLCWVCRRLKISAWRDTDLQAGSAQE